MDTLADTRLGDYRLTRVIAAGGMAAVYEGMHEPTGRPVAIKVLARKLQNRRDPLARILQEGRVICSLLHEHIVRVFDYGTAEEGIGFVVMELLRGVTLAEELTHRGPLSVERAAFIGRQVCAGLDAAHARGVYHRDIKPANIMLVEGQRHRDFVKLLDFGIAKLDADDPAKLAATATGMTLGTPQYMSPEQARADTIDPRSDIYQLGLVLYEILTNRPTFSDRNPVTLMGKHLTEQPQSIRAQRPEVSAEMEHIIMRCLAKKPADRYQSARELQEALDRVTASSTDGVITRVQASRPETGPLPNGGVVGGNLRLPTLGNPADVERYARNLSEVLDQLWPDGVPSSLRGIQDELWTLTDEQARVGTDLAVARADADALAQELEARLRPLERAIEALTDEQTRYEARMTAAQSEEGRVMAELRALDAEYAAIYTDIEQHQTTLYARSGSGGGPVDFRELFREDIAARLDELQDIFHRRTQSAEALTAVRKQMAGMLPRLADIEQQLYELKKSRLSLETERASTLARMEFTVTDLDNQHKDLERALEHRYLQLGLAFRRAVSDLLDSRTQ